MAPASRARRRCFSLDRELQNAWAEVRLQSVDESGAGPALAVAPAIRVEVTVHWSEGLRDRRVRLALVKI